MVQESALGGVKAPRLRFPQVGPMLLIWTHLRELNRGSFHVAQSRFLNHFRYKKNCKLVSKFWAFFSSFLKKYTDLYCYFHFSKARMIAVKV